MNKVAKGLIITISVIVAAGAVFAAGWYLNEYYKNQQNDQQTANINSFNDCVDAGHPVQESHPRQCSVPGGDTFVEDVDTTPEPTYVNATKEDITIATPEVNGTVTREFEVTGKAKGAWFFEGSFMLEVVSPSGDKVAQNIISAEGDWMQDGLVDFKSEIVQMPSAYRGEATLILRKNNASGLPEHDASVSIPIIVEE
jgi:hypothetical protein